jgi:hypothetical protein
MVVLPGTGHIARKMFSSSQALEALKRSPVATIPSGEM